MSSQDIFICIALSTKHIASKYLYKVILVFFQFFNTEQIFGLGDVAIIYRLYKSSGF